MLDNIAIVLMRPKYPENIGAAARVAMNMGVSRLIVVKEAEPEREKMLKMATHKAAHLIDPLERYEELGPALAEFALVIGTTARHGRQRRFEKTTREITAELLPFLEHNKVALLFGPEDTGLSNDDLQFCNLTTTIPTAEFSSLNLAQAVAVFCYDLHYAIEYSRRQGDRHVPRLATSHELQGMYNHVEEVLRRISFLKSADDTYWLRSIRDFFNRIELRAKEVRVIRGFCRQFLWYSGDRGQKVKEVEGGDDAGCSGC